MPVKRFWFYNKQVDRLAAEESLRHVEIMAAVTSSETYSALLSKLQRQMGEIYVAAPGTNSLDTQSLDGELDPEFDREGLRRLKARHCAPKPKAETSVSGE